MGVTNRYPLALNYDSLGNVSGMAEFDPLTTDLADVCSATPQTGQVLAYSGTVWCPSFVSIPGGGGGGGYSPPTTNTIGQIITSDGSNFDEVTTSALLFSHGIADNPAKIKASYEGNNDTNAFTDAQVSKLNGITTGISNGNYLVANANVADDDFLRVDGTSIEGLTAAETRTALNVEDGATADQTAGEIKTRLQSNKLTASEIADDAIGTNQIDDDAVTFAKVQHIATDTILGRDTASDGIVEVLSPATVRTLLNVENGADVTDASNVALAGALMDGEISNLSFVKTLTAGISDGNVLTANNAVADNDFLKVDGTSIEGRTAAEVRGDLNVENGADVTDATNVLAAGAMMDSSSTQNSRTFLGTDANLGDLTNVNVGSPSFGEALVYRAGGNWEAGTLSMFVGDQTVTQNLLGNFVVSNVLSTPPGTTGKGDTVLNKLVAFSGTDASATQYVGSEFGINWLQQPDQAFTAGDNFVYFSADLNDGGTSGPAVTSLNSNVKSFIQNGSGTSIGVPQVLHREIGAPVASSNSTSLAELVSFTLGENYLALGDIDIVVRGRQLAQGSNLRWNFKIGGTNVLNSAISQGTFSDFTTYTMHIQISKTATDKQLVTANFRQSTGTGSSAGRGSWAGIHRDGQITNDSVTADESTSLALSLEAQQSDAAQTVTVDHFRVTLMPDPV